MKKSILNSTLFVFLFIGIIIITQSCNSNEGNEPDKKVTITDPSPKTLSHSIINAYPHDTSSFTEGLLFYKGELYESAGNYGRSRLIKTDLKTGKAKQQISLDKKYFGEGISIINDTVYQLTYKEKAVLVYTLKDFKKVKELTFSTETNEGWGMTTDGKNLIVTDGGSNLYFFQPSTFTLIKKQAVTEGGNLAFNLNEVEFIDGFIYANQWQYPYVLKIDPAQGKVVAKYDMTDMWKRVKTINPNREVDVPNGIAYNEATKKIYVTGKLWPEIYEIQFGQ